MVFKAQQKHVLWPVYPHALKKKSKEFSRDFSQIKATMPNTRHMFASSSVSRTSRGSREAFQGSAHTHYTIWARRLQTTTYLKKTAR